LELFKSNFDPAATKFSPIEQCLVNSVSHECPLLSPKKENGRNVSFVTKSKKQITAISKVS